MRKEYRFFISSTFMDMQKERDILREEVFPELELYAKKYGVYVSFVDLRWGIQTEDCANDDEASFKIFKTCFEEIDESKPFFIGLLGDRYGWIPDISKLPLELDSRYKDFTKYNGKSITEVEMLYAIEKYGIDKDASFIYAFRNIKNEVPDDLKDVYLSSSKDDENKIKSLKKYVYESLPNSCFTYDANFNNGGIDLTDFSTKIIKKIKDVIDKLNESNTSNDPIKNSIVNQYINIEYEHDFFAGRKKELEYINNYFDNNKFLAVKGISGIGKSSLVKEYIYNLKNNNQRVIYALLGFDDVTLNVYQILAYLLYQVKQISNKPFDNKLFDKNYVIDNYNELVNELSFDIKQISKDNCLYIVLDALDQLDESNDKCLSFLNTRYFLNEDINVKILISCIGKEYINNELIIKGFNEYELSNLDISDVSEIVLNRLKKERKELNNKCMNTILNKSEGTLLCATQPLYLVMLIQFIINLNYEDFAKIEILKDTNKPEDAIYGYINDKIANLPTSIEGEFEILVEDAKKRINDYFVFNTLGIISMSRNGVRESDIVGIFERLNLKYTAFDFYYLKKLFRSFFSFKSNFYDFSHKIIDDILENYYFNIKKEESSIILKATIDYLNLLDDNDIFKEKEYLFYCFKANDIESFNNYLINHLDNKGLSNFYDLFNEGIDDNFILSSFNKLSSDAIEIIINNSDYLNIDKAKELLTIILNLCNITYENTCLVYIKLSIFVYEQGNLKDAKAFSKMAYLMSKKKKCHLDDAFEIRVLVLLKSLNMISVKRILKDSKDISPELVLKLSKKYIQILNSKKKNENVDEILIDDISNYDPFDVVRNGDSIELLISKNNNDEIIKSLINIEEANYISYINKDSNSILALAYVELLIAEIYLCNKNKDEGLLYLKKAYNNYSSLDDIIDKRNDLKNYCLCAHLLNVFKIINKKEVKRLYKRYNSKGENQNYREKLANLIVDWLVLASIALTILIFNEIVYKYFTGIVYMSGKLYQVPEYILYYFETITFILFYPMIYYLFNYLFRFNKYDFNGVRYKKRGIIYFILDIISLLVMIMFIIKTNTFNRKENIFVLFNSIYGSFILISFILCFQALKKKRNTIYEMILSNYFQLKLSIKYIVSIIMLTTLFIISFKIYNYSYYSDTKGDIYVEDMLNMLCIYGLSTLFVLTIIFFIISMIIIRRNKKKFNK